MKSRTLFWVLSISLLLLDQAVKVWARAAMAERGGIALPWPGVFELKLTYNQGVAFGMFQGFGVVLAPIAIGIAAFAAWYSWKHPDEAKITHVGLALLASGALGNLYDRIFHGKVTDLFWARIIDFPVFNVADICITFAAVILIIKWGKTSPNSQEDETPEAATKFS